MNKKRLPCIGQQARIAVRALACFLAGSAAIAALPVKAQTADAEPNDTCATAQAVDGTHVAGALSTRDDRDHFAFVLVPERRYQVTVSGRPTRGGTLSDGTLRYYSAQDCSEVAAAFNSGFETEPLLTLTAPPDGRIVLAVEAGTSARSGGTYQLRIADAINTSAVGRIVDRYTGAPLLDHSVVLKRCWTEGCSRYEPIMTRRTDSEGRFHFRRVTVTPGTFLLAEVSGHPANWQTGDLTYRRALTESVEVQADGQRIQWGTIRMFRPAAAVLSQSGCEVVYVGEPCEIVATVENRAGVDLPIVTWGVLQVDCSYPRSHCSNPTIQFTTRPSQMKPARVIIPAGGTAELRYFVTVPAEYSPWGSARLRFYISPPDDVADPHATSSMISLLLGRLPAIE